MKQRKLRVCFGFRHAGDVYPTPQEYCLSTKFPPIRRKDLRSRQTVREYANAQLSNVQTAAFLLHIQRAFFVCSLLLALLSVLPVQNWAWFFGQSTKVSSVPRHLFLILLIVVC
jgi:hypothetical protein